MTRARRRKMKSSPTPKMRNQSSTRNNVATKRSVTRMLAVAVSLVVLSLLFIFLWKPSTTKTPPSTAEIVKSLSSISSLDMDDPKSLVALPENMFQQIREHTRTILDFGARVPDNTPGYLKTKDYLQRNMDELSHASNYFHEISAQTPLGKKKFSNFIVEFGDRKGSSKKEIIFAAHYESKLFPKEAGTGREFLGATDSVVSCAMLLELAKWIDSNWNSVGAQMPFFLTFVFFDGEEAFEEWTSTDSIYGAKALAEKWESEDRLKQIELFFLLDLIGSKKTKLYKYVFHPDHYHQLLLNSQKQVNSLGSRRGGEYFDSTYIPRVLVEDDHTPFIKRNVPTIHMIPVPFPSIWHTYDDDWEHIDWDSVETIQHTLMQFLKNVVHLTNNSN